MADQAPGSVVPVGFVGLALRVTGHLVISTGSVSPDYSRCLAADVLAAGGRFVESPVSGSRGPAEAGVAHTAASRCESDRRSPRPEPPGEGDKCSGGVAQ